MMTLEQIQTAVKELSPTEQYEFSKWLLRQIESDPITEEITDSLALERFQALDAEESSNAQSSPR